MLVQRSGFVFGFEIFFDLTGFMVPCTRLRLRLQDRTNKQTFRETYRETNSQEAKKCCRRQTYRETYRGGAKNGEGAKIATKFKSTLFWQSSSRDESRDGSRRGLDRFYYWTALYYKVPKSSSWRNLVWFGLVGLSFNASPEPQPRARRRARLAEDAPARNAFWTGHARPNPGTACAA